MTSTVLVPFVAATSVSIAGGLPWLAALVNGTIWGSLVFVGVWAVRHEQGVRRVRAESAVHRDPSRTATRPMDQGIGRSG